MTGDERTARPDRWRRALGPLGALWVAGGLVAVAPGHDPRRLAFDPGPGWTGPVLATAALMLAWTAAGLLTPLLAPAVEGIWLGRWPVGGGPLTAHRRARWDRADQRVRDIDPGGPDGPEAVADAMRRRAAIALARPCRPTWMGDRWSAIEQRIGTAYGLDVVTVWPRLWLALPEPARAELRAAKSGWDRSAELAAWAVPFGALGAAWWPFLGVAAVLAVAGWHRGRAAVAYRADLVESAFDLHAARLPRLLVGLDPVVGLDITAHLRKGT
ncbi:hypothetical protein [Dactylosporangium sp. NPDC000521]|uniref:hypothetical protein n=1 Tax=Dactylosporangium sp. NPDC000521 TaxID=3363975 RepID=UPI0036931B10